MALGLGLRENGHLIICRVLLLAAAVATVSAGVSGLRSRAEFAEFNRWQQPALSIEYHRFGAAAWSVAAILFGAIFFLAACFVDPARGT